LPPNKSSAFVDWYPRAATQDRPRAAEARADGTASSGSRRHQLESAHWSSGVAFDREKQHGRLHAFAAQARAKLEAVHIGIMTSSRTRFERLCAQAFEAREAVVRDVGAVALGFEVLSDAGARCASSSTTRMCARVSFARLPATNRDRRTFARAGAHRIDRAARKLDEPFRCTAESSAGIVRAQLVADA